VPKAKVESLRKTLSKVVTARVCYIGNTTGMMKVGQARRSYGCSVEGSRRCVGALRGGRTRSGPVGKLFPASPKNEIRVSLNALSVRLD
jgi:hypothetical protein